MIRRRKPWLIWAGSVVLIAGTIASTMIDSALRGLTVRPLIPLEVISYAYVATSTATVPIGVGLIGLGLGLRQRSIQSPRRIPILVIGAAMVASGLAMVPFVGNRQLSMIGPVRPIIDNLALYFSAIQPTVLALGILLLVWGTIQPSVGAKTSDPAQPSDPAQREL